MFVHVHVYVDIFLYMTHLGCQLITYLTNCSQIFRGQLEIYKNILSPN